MTSIERHDLDRWFSGGDAQESHAGKQLEASRPRRARIDHQTIALSIDHRTVSVSEHDDIGVVARGQARRRGGAQLVAVAHVNLQSSEQQIDPIDQSTIGRICVAPHRTDRRDAAESSQDPRAPDVACMQDQFDTCKRGQRFRPHQAVGVRYETDKHHLAGTRAFSSSNQFKTTLICWSKRRVGSDSAPEAGMITRKRLPSGMMS